MTHTATVPLYDPARHPPPSELYDPLHPRAVPQRAHLSYDGGPLLGAVRVVPVFWGDAWRAPALTALVARLEAFYAAFVVGPTLARLAAEYSVPRYPLRFGSVVPSLYVPRASTRAVSDGQIRRMLSARSRFGAADGWPFDTLPVVHTQPGMAVSQGGSRSCATFCGYHDAIGDPALPWAYAVLPYPDCFGCLGGLSVSDALTSVASHELAEAITDPLPGTGWYDHVDDAEVGDLCAWIQGSEGGFTVQREWSNAAQACL